MAKWLNPGDTAYGYDLTTANLNDDDLAGMKGQQLPEIILVKKSYPNRRNTKKARHWKLKALAKEQELARRNAELAKEAREYEEFMQELEEDPERRAQVTLYRAEGVAPPAAAVGGAMMEGIEDANGPVQNFDDEAEADFPEVGMDELLDEMAELTMEIPDNGNDGPLTPAQFAMQQQLYLDQNGQ